MVRRHFQPEPLPAPLVDVDLPVLSPIERAAEVIRYVLTRLEYWLSPKGALREYIKLNLLASVCVAVPVLLVAPLVTITLERFKGWITLLSESMSSFVLFPLSVILSILLICGLIYIGRALLEMRYRATRREHYY